jgi:hypothetical protein
MVESNPPRNSQPETHPGIHGCVPDDEAAGGVHDEGVGGEILKDMRSRIRCLVYCHKCFSQYYTIDTNGRTLCPYTG